MKTVKDLNFTLGDHNWQTKELIPIQELAFVIQNLLKEEFVVEIEGHKYDISFGYNKKENFIGQSWSSAPSPHLTTAEIIEKGFRVGTWYLVKK